jgi:phospholipase C
MRHGNSAPRKRRLSTSILASVLAFSMMGGPAGYGVTDPDKAVDSIHTDSPIKHLIVLIGENRSFDHLFATYEPKSDDSISNLLSKGIVNEDGTPGPRFKRSQQFQATAPFQTEYYISLDKSQKSAYTTLPEPTLNFAPTTPLVPTILKGTPLLPLIEPSLDADDLNLLFTGTIPSTVSTQTFELPDFDSRVQNFNALPNGSFPLKGTALPFDSYTGDTTHRLFEMWQQSDCNVKNATERNPSGCLSDLYPFVITSYTNIPDPFSAPLPNKIDDNGGGNSMAFYNMQQGDAPVFKRLADEFTISDNFHQSFMGGTGANHVMLGTGDAIFWSDGMGNATIPPSHIANPNPQKGTNNIYTVDINFDGNFTECGDAMQPGIAPIRNYLESLPYNPDPRCELGHFYMINNDSPGFLPDGTVDTAGIASGGSIPPVNTRTVGEALNEKNIPWAYYGGAYNAAVNLQHNPKTTDPTILVGSAYCNICNFESYATAIMGDPVQRAAHIKDATDFFAAIDNDTLPAVSFVKPDGLLDGHPASSKWDLFEGMVENTLDHLHKNPELEKTTAFMITVDEGGGFYDSGYIQPVDFFGDGPRIPLIIVSPFTRGGRVNHTYADHVSILKFIERNWDLKPLTSRSRDNFPNPKSDDDNPYVPKNSPAISDLFDMFHFDRDGDHREGDRDKGDRNNNDGNSGDDAGRN